jgi:hypothetical protein
MTIQRWKKPDCPVVTIIRKSKKIRKEGKRGSKLRRGTHIRGEGEEEEEGKGGGGGG